MNGRDLSGDLKRAESEVAVERAAILLAQHISLAVGDLNLRDLIEDRRVQFHHLFVGDAVQVEVVQNFLLLLDHHTHGRIAANAVQRRTTVVERDSGRATLCVGWSCGRCCCWRCGRDGCGGRCPRGRWIGCSCG